MPILISTLIVAVSMNPTVEHAQAGGRFLALGDSYTIGEGVAPEDRWPAQLARRLRTEGIAIGDPQIIATTGWTTDELSTAMDKACVVAAVRAGYVADRRQQPVPRPKSVELSQGIFCAARSCDRARG